MMRKDYPDITGMSFGQGMAELEALVKRLESREVDLEESLVDFERGHALQAHLSEKLRVIELRIEKIATVVPEPGEARDETGSSGDSGDDGVRF